MSQASKQVKWCIAKAKKEIDECIKQGKREKHRGLLKINENLKSAKQHIEKAKHNLKGINYLLKGGFGDLCISTIFYTEYHCFLAIASKFGYESSNQTCTIALIEMLNEEKKIDIDEKYINMLKYTDVEEKQANSLIEMREESTYGIEITTDNTKRIKELIEDCKNLIDITMQIIYD
jgi:uncharacterized protein (UPF0332 family)